MATVNAYEWLDGNMHRNYPIADSCSCESAAGIILPSSFLVDIDINLPASETVIDKSAFFISGIMRHGDSFTVEISYHTSTQDILCGRSNPIAVSIRNTDDIGARTFGINHVAVDDDAYAAFNGLHGSLIIGSCIDMQALGNLTFQFERSGSQTATLLSVRIHEATSGLSSVTIVDSEGHPTTFRTDFIIQAGDGVSLTVDSDDAGTPRLNIRRVATAVETATPYSDVSDVIAAVFAQVGQPIMRINNMAPTANGDFTITGDDCTEIESAMNGIIVNNSCAKPCCGSDTPSDVEAAVTTLQDAQDRLAAYYENLMSAVNSMQAKLTSLIVAGRTS